MTIEERQIRAWINRVFRHAAIRWVRTQAHQSVPSPLSWDDQEVQKLWLSEELNSWVGLSMSLSPLPWRDQQVLRALYQGWTQVEIAQALHCSTRTVRRAIQRIRRQCH